MEKIIRPQHLKTAKGKRTAEAIAEKLPDNLRVRIVEETENRLVFRILKGEKGSAPSTFIPEGAAIEATGLLSVELEAEKEVQKSELPKKKKAGKTKKAQEL